MNKTLIILFILIMIYLIITKSSNFKTLISTFLYSSSQAIKKIQGRWNNMKNMVIETIGGIGILIGIYLFVKNFNGTVSIIKAISTPSISVIKTLQGRWKWCNLI